MQDDADKERLLRVIAAVLCLIGSAWMIVLIVRVFRGLSASTGGEAIMTLHALVSALLVVLMFLRARGRRFIYPTHMRNGAFIWVMNIFLNFGWAGEAQRGSGRLRAIFILCSVMSMLLGAVGLWFDVSFGDDN